MTNLRNFYYSFLVLHVAIILSVMVHAQDDQSEMTLFKSLFSVLILRVAVIVVYAQDDQSGFISIDCGIPQGTSYTDSITGIRYVSDEDFIESGENHDISAAFELDARQHAFSNLRSFPENDRNCYTLRPQKGKGNRYLIRASFMYGNYDSRDLNPQFDLYLGAEYWATVNITKQYHKVSHEIIHLTPSDYINVCLVNTRKGNPFISVLELRLLDITMYKHQSGSPSLILTIRQTLGSDEEMIRYQDDKFDRIWIQLGPVTGTRYVSTSSIVSPGTSDEEHVPSKVMSTAITGTSSTDLTITWNAANTTDKFIIYAHFAEVEILDSNQKREFTITLNGEDWSGGPYSPSTNISTLRTNFDLAHTGSLIYIFELKSTPSSTLPPILNALEIYTIKKLLQNQTKDEDAAAIWSIKSTYGLVIRKWQGDPCFPKEYVWVGLNCSYNDPGAARIISLNLSNDGLNGEIATALANLTMIQSLDFSYNNLTGHVPEFLAQLDSLMFLDLRGNNFTRPLPAKLLSKSKKGLSLSIEEINNQDVSTCPNGSCKKKNNKVVILVISITAIFVVVLFVIVWIVLKRRKTKVLIRREEPFSPRHKHYTYSEVEDITKNFTNVIGGGGFGTVYHGHVGDNQVAVKMLSKSSNQGDKQFQAEVKLLMDVRHKNITSLIGYCNDSGEKGIIYEFMVNGNLEKHLFDRSLNVLSWESRLQIACDAAEGLEYMHHGCSPPIIHRDVKSSNILLDESFQAKLGDLGLSKAFATADASHVSTQIVGTRGYLDPQYHTSWKLTEKSDMYSFGVVLLELITSRRVLLEGIYIIDWIKPMVEEGSVEKLIDPRLEGVFNINTAWKIVELALACVSSTSIDRPNMNEVVRDLKNCLQEVKTRQSKNQTENVSVNMESVSEPSPR